MEVTAAPIDSCKTTEKTQKLCTLKFGDVFRFTDTTYESALTTTGDLNGFFMVVNLPPVETNRVAVMAMATTFITKKDGDRLVIPHQAKLQVSLAERVPVD